jgi:signal transduction histidine kinase/HAMP domain-containing protein
MALKLTTKIFMALVLVALIPVLIVSSFSIALFNQTHNYSMTTNEQSQLSNTELYFTSIAEEKSLYYDNFFNTFVEMTLDQTYYMKNSYDNRANFGNISTYWDDLNESKGFNLDPWSASCVHLGINSTNSIKVNNSGNYLVTLNTTTGLTDYHSTSTPQIINSTLNETIRLTAPMDLLWNSSTRNNPYVGFSYFGSKYGMHRSLPWHLMSEENRIYDPRLRGWYKTGKASLKGEVKVSEPYYDWSTNDLILTFTSPFYYNNEFQGVMSNDVFITTIVQDIFEPLNYKSAYQFLIDPTGNIVARPTVDNNSDIRWDETFKINSSTDKLNTTSNTKFNSVINKMVSGKTGLERITFAEGGDKYIVYNRINSTNWSYGVVVSVDEIIGDIIGIQENVQAELNQTLILLYTIIGITIGVATLSGYAITKTFTRQIRKLMEATAKISSGDYDIDLDMDSGDEFAELAKSFEKMANDTGQRINSIFQIIPEGIALITFDGEITLFNELFYVHMRDLNAPEDLTGANIFEISETPIIKLLKKFVNNDKDKVVKIVQQKTFEARDNYFLKITALRTDTGYLITIQDVSTYLNFQRLQKQFISNVSHELRTPITGLTLSIQNLEKFGERLSPEKKEKILQIISLNGTVLSEMIEDLLLASSIEGKKLVLAFEPIYIRKIMDKVLKQVYFRLKKKNLKVDLDFNENFEYSTDERRIEQVFRILIDNAIKYTKAEKNIFIKLTENYQYIKEDKKIDGVLISVKDQGIGIPKQDIDKLFHRFYRASNTNKISGTGLGLNIAKDIVERHSGYLFVESEIKVGTTFNIFLPYEKIETASDPKK